jgi:methylenetetrahydrofolate dehydrogenase (NADP+) / methenyltetrahydrofolate cyclohydrolase
MAQILDGNRIRDEIKNECRPRVEKLAALGRPPGLAVVLVGHNPASEIYVRGKVKTSQELGIYSETLTPPDSISTDALLGIVDELNRRPDIDGILVQMPLPPQIDQDAITKALDPDKDVDGLHPLNAGRLVAGQPGLVPCTPSGCLIMLRRTLGDIAGLNALVIGRSILVGKPVALLLLQANCTVTVAHSKTRDLAEVCRRADIVVAALGRAEFVRGDWLKPGATVIDVGISRIERDGKKRIVGDVAYDEALSVAGAITPVPGGVGPMTIACLLENTVRAACLRRGIEFPGS